MTPAAPHSLVGTGGFSRRSVPRKPASAVSGASRTLRLSDLPARIFLLLIRLYQRTLSPALPVLTMGRCGCRFSPTCSHYAAEAIQTHGALRGLALAVVRLVKCTPLHPGGFDPVPPRRAAVAPRCVRASAAFSSPASSLPPSS